MSAFRSILDWLIHAPPPSDLAPMTLPRSLHLVSVPGSQTTFQVTKLTRFRRPIACSDYWGTLSSPGLCIRARALLLKLTSRCCGHCGFRSTEGEDILIVGMHESLVWVDVSSPGAMSFSFLSNRSYFQIVVLEDINFMVSISGNIRAV